MRLTHVNEMPCLEQDEIIYLTDQQFKTLSTMNGEQAKAFLIREVMQGLTEKEQASLKRWLADSSINWHLQVQ